MCLDERKYKKVGKQNNNTPTTESNHSNKSLRHSASQEETT